MSPANREHLLADLTDSVQVKDGAQYDVRLSDLALHLHNFVPIVLHCSRRGRETLGSVVVGYSVLRVGLEQRNRCRVGPKSARELAEQDER